MAAEKKQYKPEYMTAVGTATYCHLKYPEKYQGKDTDKNSIQIVFDEAETDKLVNLIRKTYEEAKASDEFKGKKWRSDEDRLSIKRDDDGNIVGLKFVRKYEIKDKTTGDKLKNTPLPIFDSTGKNRIDGVNLANGSKVRVRFTIAPYNETKDNNGVSLWMTQLQVIELIEYKPGGGGGFDAYEGGYVAPSDADAPFPSEEIPF